jgi:two-component system cell cycle sensor histidine kinase/response regulator CckA
MRSWLKDWLRIAHCGSIALQIHAVCERAADLTHKLLDFSRGDAVRPTLTDLNSIVYVVGDLLQPLTGTHIDWVMRLDPSGPRIKADSGQIHQALVNLVLNAGEAMPAGGTLTIETGSFGIDARTGAYALLAVSDTGEGFDEETRNQLFEPRFTTKQKGRASGFGLATVRHIVTEAGGWLRVHGEPGKGARFEVYLPQE